MVSGNSWAVLWLALLLMVFGLFFALEEYEARTREEHLWHDEGMHPMSRRELGRRLFTVCAIFPIGVMVALEALGKPLAAGGSGFSLICDRAARAGFSLLLLWLLSAVIRKQAQLFRGSARKCQQALQAICAAGAIFLLALWPWLGSGFLLWWRLLLLAALLLPALLAKEGKLAP